MSFLLQKYVKNLQIMGDCGAFTYADQQEPPYSVDEVINFYEGLNLDFGLHAFGTKAIFRRSAFTLSLGSIFRRWDWKDESLTQIVTQARS